MDSAELVRVALGYIEYTEALPRLVSEDAPVPEGLENAYDKLHKVVREGPADLAWRLVIEVLRRAPDDNLDRYAAGPLEDVVRRWGVDLVDAIEEEASRDERFRRALGYIWLMVGDLPGSVLARIVQASGGHIQPVDDHGLLRLFDRAT